MLGLPSEIRRRVYRFCFSDPIISIWDAERTSPLGHWKDVERGPNELAYRRSIADDFDEDQYQLRSTTDDGINSLTLGWLEDYRGLFLTCRQMTEEAGDVLGPLLHLKILFNDRIPCDAPRAIKQLYYGEIRQLTLMYSPPRGHLPRGLPQLQ